MNDGTTGLVVESENAADIAAGVLSILTDETFRAKARKEGTAFVNAQYGMDRMITETLAAYGMGHRAAIH